MFAIGIPLRRVTGTNSVDALMPLPPVLLPASATDGIAANAPRPESPKSPDNAALLLVNLP
jgi:hypothetical protein